LTSDFIVSPKANINLIKLQHESFFKINIILIGQMSGIH